MNFNGKIITALNMYGKSTQDGSPTPDSPIDIVSVTNPVVTLTGKNLLNLDRTASSFSTASNTATRIFNLGCYYVGMSANNYSYSSKITSYEVTSDTVTLTASQTAYGIGFPIEVAEGESYIVTSEEYTGQHCYTFYDSDGNYLSYVNAVQTFPYTITVPSGASIMMALFKASSASTECYISFPMIRHSSQTDSTYQEYVSNQYYLRKNLLENTASTTTSNGITFTVNSDGSVTLNGTASANSTLYLQGGSTIPFEEGNYILSGVTGGSDSTYRMQFNATVSGSSSALGYCRDGDVIITIPDPSTITSYSCYIIVFSGVTVENITIYPMIRKAEIIDDTYEQYSDTEAVLRAIPCTSGGNFTDSNGQMWYADEWDIVNGTITRYCYELTLDGSSTTGLYTYSSYSGFYLATSELTKMLSQRYGVGFCTHLSALSSMSDTGIAFGSSNATLYMPYLQTYLSISSVSEFATWLASNNMTIVYPLAETTEESV